MLRSEFWPEPTAHRLYWERHNCAYVYEYDPADDGPEVEVIQVFKINFPLTWDATINRAGRELSRNMADWLGTQLAVLNIEESQ